MVESVEGAQLVLEATDLLAASELARDALGPELCDLYVRSRRSDSL